MFRNFKKFISAEAEGIGVVEVILILLVLILLVVVFKDQLTGIVNSIFKNINDQGKHN